MHKVFEYYDTELYLMWLKWKFEYCNSNDKRSSSWQAYVPPQYQRYIPDAPAALRSPDVTLSCYLQAFGLNQSQIEAVEEIGKKDWNTSSPFFNCNNPYDFGYRLILNKSCGLLPAESNVYLDLTPIAIIDHYDFAFIKFKELDHECIVKRFCGVLYDLNLKWIGTFFPG